MRLAEYTSTCSGKRLVQFSTLDREIIMPAPNSEEVYGQNCMQTQREPSDGMAYDFYIERPFSVDIAMARGDPHRLGVDSRNLARDQYKSRQYGEQ